MTHGDMEENVSWCFFSEHSVVQHHRMISNMLTVLLTIKDKCLEVTLKTR